MTSTKPEADPQRRYSQVEAARLLGLHPNTLREWELKGIAKFRHVRANGKKFMTGAEILRLWLTVF